MRTMLAVLLLVGVAFAEPLEIRFSTLPPDCQVADLDQPTVASQASKVMVERPAKGKALRFRLLKAGYTPLEVTIPSEALPPTGRVVTWPQEKGAFLRLEPQLVAATFLTSPAGAQIWTSRTGRSDDYLGVTGQPVLLNLADLLGTNDDGFFRIRLVAPGYQSVDIPIPRHLFGDGRPNRWPAVGEYALAPTGGVLAPLVFHFRLKPVTSGLVVLVGLCVGLVLWRLLRRGWSAVVRARQIESRLAEPGMALAGSRLGPYRLFEMLGKGATATVFRGELDRSDGPPESLAIKVFHLRADAASRLAAEVRPLLELRHPNLVSLLDWGQSGQFVYLVTELVPGRTLRQELEHGPMLLGPWRDLVNDLLLGLGHAHERGVVHGDIKPDNILLPWHGRAKLVDFGLARRILHPGLERFGGTPGYMAPEVLSSHSATSQSDLYSAGVVLHEALFGRLPGASAEVPESLAEVARALAKMLNAQPEQRWDDAEEARQALLSIRVSSANR